MTIVGDTHGQLFDLLTILHLNDDKLPSEENVYLFNGDFVDRGPHSAEVLLLLFALKLHCPRGVFFNRGNHEHRRINARYGFEDQMLARYDDELYDMVQATFELLPLGAVVDEKILVLHGGLFDSPDVSLEDLCNIEYKKQLPRHKEITTDGDRLMEQMLWSDPREDFSEGELSRKSTRGAGVHFSPEVTMGFLKKNNLDYIIRSHEHVQLGYDIMHNERMVTIFSASNYTGDHDNQGAVVVLDWGDPAQRADSDAHGEQWRPQFRQFWAQAGGGGGTGAAADLQLQTIQRLREKVFMFREQLAMAFQRYDRDQNGKLTVDQWTSAMKEVIPLDLPWKTLLPYLAKVEKVQVGENVVDAGEQMGYVNYSTFLKRYNIQADKSFIKKWKKRMVASISAELANHFSDLRSAFANMDANQDGKLT